MKYTLRTVALMGIVLLPVIAEAAVTIVGGSNGSGGSFLGVSFGGGGGGNMSCSGTICTVASTILYLINFVLVPLLFAISFITFLYGIAKAYIFSYGESKAVEQGHRLVLWGIVAFAVMISIWGLVNVAANTFGLAGYVAPRLPRSY
jgi:hypothetical protein